MQRRSSTRCWSLSFSVFVVGVRLLIRVGKASRYAGEIIKNAPGAVIASTFLAKKSSQCFLGNHPIRPGDRIIIDYETRAAVHAECLFAAKGRLTSVDVRTEREARMDQFRRELADRRDAESAASEAEPAEPAEPPAERAEPDRSNAR